MTIYIAFHWIYSLLHFQCFIENLAGGLTGEWWENILGFLITELGGHFAIYCLSRALKEPGARSPAEPPVPDMSELEAEIHRYTATLREASSLLEARIPLLAQENRELEAELEAMQEAAFRRMSDDL